MDKGKAKAPLSSQKSLYTPVFYASSQDFTFTPSSKKDRTRVKDIAVPNLSSANLKRLAQLSKKHIALSQSVQEVPDSRGASPSPDEPSSPSQDPMLQTDLASGLEPRIAHNPRIRHLRAQVTQTLATTSYDPADGQWATLSRLLRLPSTLGRTHWLGTRTDGTPIDVATELGIEPGRKTNVRGVGWCNADTEEEWEEWERRFRDEMNLKRRVSEWSRAVEPEEVSPVTDVIEEFEEEEVAKKPKPGPALRNKVVDDPLGTSSNILSFSSAKRTGTAAALRVGAKASGSRPAPKRPPKAASAKKRDIADISGMSFAPADIADVSAMSIAPPLVPRAGPNATGPSSSKHPAKTASAEKHNTTGIFDISSAGLPQPLRVAAKVSGSRPPPERQFEAAPEEDSIVDISNVSSNAPSGLLRAGNKNPDARPPTPNAGLAQKHNIEDISDMSFAPPSFPASQLVTSTPKPVASGGVGLGTGLPNFTIASSPVPPPKSPTRRVNKPSVAATTTTTTTTTSPRTPSRIQKPLSALPKPKFPLSGLVAGSLSPTAARTPNGGRAAEPLSSRRSTRPFPFPLPIATAPAPPPMTPPPIRRVYGRNSQTSPMIIQDPASTPNSPMNVTTTTTSSPKGVGSAGQQLLTGVGVVESEVGPSIESRGGGGGGAGTGEEVNGQTKKTPLLGKAGSTPAILPSSSPSSSPSSPVTSRQRSKMSQSFNAAQQSPSSFSFLYGSSALRSKGEDVAPTSPTRSRTVVPVNDRRNADYEEEEEEGSPRPNGYKAGVKRKLFSFEGRKDEQRERGTKLAAGAGVGGSKRAKLVHAPPPAADDASAAPVSEVVVGVVVDNFVTPTRKTRAQRALAMGNVPTPPEEGRGAATGGVLPTLTDLLASSKKARRERRRSRKSLGMNGGDSDSSPVKTPTTRGATGAAAAAAEGAGKDGGGGSFESIPGLRKAGRPVLGVGPSVVSGGGGATPFWTAPTAAVVVVSGEPAPPSLNPRERTPPRVVGDSGDDIGVQHVSIDLSPPSHSLNLDFEYGQSPQANLDVYDDDHGLSLENLDLNANANHLELNGDDDDDDDPTAAANLDHNNNNPDNIVEYEMRLNDVYVPGLDKPPGLRGRQGADNDEGGYFTDNDLASPAKSLSSLAGSDSSSDDDNSDFGGEGEEVDELAGDMSFDPQFASTQKEEQQQAMMKMRKGTILTMSGSSRDIFGFVPPSSLNPFLSSSSDAAGAAGAGAVPGGGAEVEEEESPVKSSQALSSFRASSKSSHRRRPTARSSSQSGFYGAYNSQFDVKKRVEEVDRLLERDLDMDSMYGGGGSVFGEGGGGGGGEDDDDVFKKYVVQSDGEEGGGGGD